MLGNRKRAGIARAISDLLSSIVTDATTHQGPAHAVKMLDDPTSHRLGSEHGAGSLSARQGESVLPIRLAARPMRPDRPG